MDIVVGCIGVVLIVGALTFIPALALGPIVEHLQLSAPRIFLSSFNRPNLHYDVRPKDGAFAELVELLRMPRHRNESTIVLRSICGRIGGAKFVLARMLMMLESDCTIAPMLDATTQ